VREHFRAQCCGNLIRCKLSPNWFHRVLPSRFFQRVSLLASIAFRGFNVER
jgi:hypothetical protein